MTLPAERRGWYDHLKTSSDELIDAAYFIAHSLGFHHICTSPTRLLPKSNVRPKLWSIKLLQHFEDTLQRESQISQENVAKSLGDAATLQRHKSGFRQCLRASFKTILWQNNSPQLACVHPLQKKKAKQMDTNGR